MEINKDFQDMLNKVMKVIDDIDAIVCFVEDCMIEIGDRIGKVLEQGMNMDDVMKMIAEIIAEKTKEATQQTSPFILPQMYDNNN